MKEWDIIREMWCLLNCVMVSIKLQFMLSQQSRISACILVTSCDFQSIYMVSSWTGFMLASQYEYSNLHYFWVLKKLVSEECPCVFVLVQATTVLAKQLINLRKQKTRLYGASAQISSVNAQTKVTSMWHKEWSQCITYIFHSTCFCMYMLLSSLLVCAHFTIII